MNSGSSSRVTENHKLVPSRLDDPLISLFLPIPSLGALGVFVSLVERKNLTELEKNMILTCFITCNTILYIIK